jgi:hypothetical protein
VGELDPEALRAPLLICHGGPGATHDCVEPIAELRVVEEFLERVAGE